MHRLVLLAVVTCGCGRIDFDALTDGGSNATTRSVVLPDGGQMSDLAIAPDGTWYAASDNAGAFRSTDQGATWTHCGARVGTALAVTSDNAVWMSGADVGRSTDACATWADTGNPRFSDGIFAEGTNVWALTDQGLRSWNGSQWVVITTPVGLNRFQSMSHGASRYFIGTYSQGLLVSTDAVTWTQVTAGLDSNHVAIIASSGTRSYAMTQANPNHGISCSDATGATWTSCYFSGGLTLAVDPNNDQHVIAAVYDDLAETTNAFAGSAATRGLREMSMDAAIVEDMRYLPGGGLLLATDRGVFASTAAAPLTFAPRLTGLDAWDVDDILQDGDDMWLITRGGPLHSIRGAPFTANTTGITGNTVIRGIAVAPDGSVWLGGRSLFRSTDRGDTWSVLHAVDVPDGYFTSEIVFMGMRAFVGTGTRVISADPPGYDTWTPHMFASGNHLVISLHVRGSELWIGTSQGLHVSTDMAATIQPVSALGSVAVLDFVDLPDGRLAVATNDGVWISDAATFGAFSRAGLGGVVVDGLTLVGTTIVAATNQGVRYTRDDGVTWTPLPGAENLPSSATILDDTTGQLLVGSNSRGLVRLPMP